MSEQVQKLVLRYEMKTREYYFLLKLIMGLNGKERISGVKDTFFDEFSEEESKKILENLKKDKILNESDGNIAIREGVRRQLDIITSSIYSCSFKNSTLQNAQANLHFYYDDQTFVGIYSTKSKTIITSCDDCEGVMAAFEKELLAKSIQEDFKLEQWHEWSNNKFETPITEPICSFETSLVSNVFIREAFHTTVVGDQTDLHIVRNGEFHQDTDAVFEKTSIDQYYGVIRCEIMRLQKETEFTRKDGSVKGSGYNPYKDTVKEPTDYEKIVSSKMFPQNGFLLVPYIVLMFLKNLPKMVVDVFKNKMVSVILMAIWTILLFGYNMYATCFINDTFMFDRKAVWGNLTPYVMGGQISTPSKLYGFEMNMGTIETTYLVAPLFILITFLLKILYDICKKRKFSGVVDLLTAIPKSILIHFKGGIDTNVVWIMYAVAVMIAFVIFNPLTTAILSLLFFMIYTQGRDSAYTQFIMIGLCAINRPKVEKGLKNQPTYDLATNHIGVWAQGFAIASILNFILWNVCQYSFYMRGIATIMLVLLACLQLALSKQKRAKDIVVKLFLLAFHMLIVAQTMVVFADDGGISESGGSIYGWLQNAGFSAILGISVATIIAAVVGTIVVPAVIGGVVGSGLMLSTIGDTGWSEYVTKSSGQFFFGSGDDSLTILCGAVKVIDIVSSLLTFKPTATNSTRVGMKIMSFTKDGLFLTGSSTALYSSIKENGVMSNENFDELVAFGLDTFSIYGSLGDLYKARNVASLEPQKWLGVRIDDIQVSGQAKIADNIADTNRKISNTNADYSKEITTLQNEINSIKNSNNLLENTDAFSAVTKKEASIITLQSQQSQAIADINKTSSQIHKNLVDNMAMEVLNEIATNTVGHVHNMYDNKDLVTHNVLFNDNLNVSE
ncbi:MAG: hypothetical protein R3Y54_02355 [Eubacteriales bacterium]